MSHEHVTDLSQEPEGKKVRLAVYDFDGTCIRGNSPVLLVNYLMRRRMLTFWQGLGIGMWGLRYKLRLPQDEASVRGKVFRPFDGESTEDVDSFLRGFYDEVVACRWRADADASMRENAAQGCYVMVVTATWQAIVDRAMEDHPFEYAVATRMLVDDQGNYTRSVDGLPMEGEEKLRAVEEFANERFGEGGWELARAYGDHHSDSALLAAAQCPCAVDPDKPLRRTARKLGWPILAWS